MSIDNALVFLKGKYNKIVRIGCRFFEVWYNPSNGKTFKEELYEPQILRLAKHFALEDTSLWKRQIPEVDRVNFKYARGVKYDKA